MKKTYLFILLVALVAGSQLAFAQLKVDAQGKVGIGTNLPNSKLMVSGAETSGSGNNAAISLKNTSSSIYNTWYFRTGASGTITPNGGFSIADSLSYLMKFTSTQNGGFVGIGTAFVPYAKLMVSGSETSGSGNGSAISIKNTSASTYNTWYLRAGANGTTTPDGGFSIADSLSYIMKFTSTQNGGFVGIGTPSAPNAKFMVTGSETSPDGMKAAIALTNTAAGGNAWLFRVGTSTTTTPAGGFSIADNHGYRLAIDSIGNVGIGTTTPSYKLDVNGTTNIKDVLRLEPRATEPGSPTEGCIYIDSSTHHIKCYLNGTWKQLD